MLVDNVFLRFDVRPFRTIIRNLNVQPDERTQMQVSCKINIRRELQKFVVQRFRVEKSFPRERFIFLFLFSESLHILAITTRLDINGYIFIISSTCHRFRHIIQIDTSLLHALYSPNNNI